MKNNLTKCFIFKKSNTIYGTRKFFKYILYKRILTIKKEINLRIDIIHLKIFTKLLHVLKP
jgi:hypothetical protein